MNIVPDAGLLVLLEVLKVDGVDEALVDGRHPRRAQHLVDHGQHVVGVRPAQARVPLHVLRVHLAVEHVDHQVVARQVQLLLRDHRASRGRLLFLLLLLGDPVLPRPGQRRRPAQNVLLAPAAARHASDERGPAGVDVRPVLVERVDAVVGHLEEDVEGDVDAHQAEVLQPLERLLLHLGGRAHEPLGDEAVHLAGVEAERAHVRVEDLAEDALELGELVARRLLVDGLHPLRHDAVPHLEGDDVVGHQAEEPVEPLLDVVDLGKDHVPVAAHLGVVRRVRQHARHEDLRVRLAHLPQPLRNVLGLELLQRGSRLVAGEAGRGVEPLKARVTDRKLPSGKTIIRNYGSIQGWGNRRL